MKRKTGLLIFSLVLFIESESMFQRQKKQNFTFITFVHTKAFHAKGAHKMVYQDKAKNCIITPHHISTKCVNMLFLNFSQF